MRNKYRYGRIEVIIKDGLPIAIEKTVERESLYIVVEGGRIQE